MGLSDFAGFAVKRERSLVTFYASRFMGCQTPEFSRSNQKKLCLH